MLHQIKLIFAIAKAGLQAQAAYRLAAVIWIINGFITPLLLTIIWLTIRRHNPLALNENQIITYFLLAILVMRLTQSWSADNLGRKIREGDLARHLIQPISYLTHEIASDLTHKLIRLISLSPFAIIAMLVWQHNLEINLQPMNILLFTLAIFSGYILSFLSEACMGLLSFWLEHHEGAYTMFSLTRELLSGFIVPLALMPTWLQQVAKWSPFRYFISYPIELITTTPTAAQLIQGTIGIFIWLVILLALIRFMYAQGIKKFTAAGI